MGRTAGKNDLRQVNRSRAIAQRINVVRRAKQDDEPQGCEGRTPIIGRYSCFRRFIFTRITTVLAKILIGQIL
jgi:hypothetical protein